MPTLTAVETSTFSPLAIEAINFLIVTSTANTPTPGTLLSAINASNANPSVSLYLPNQIVFEIPGTGLQTIELASGLPTITTPVVIDGYSQAGSQGNVSGGSFGVFDTQETDVATITVQIDGSGIGGVVNGLTIAAQNCTIDGLIITGFSGGAGIALEAPVSTAAGVPGDTIWGNFIGVPRFNPKTYNPVVAAANFNANGVGVSIATSGNMVGGASPIDRNVIQGNLSSGVVLDGTLNAVESNFILDNGGDGVLVEAANNSIGLAIGLGASGAGNVISGNRVSGVHILGPSARGNIVASNEIGTQVGLAGVLPLIRGTQARANFGDGILIEDAPVNIIGGASLYAGNVIAGQQPKRRHHRERRHRYECDRQSRAGE